MSDYVNAAATPRTIPWDCSDWQASAAVDDAEDARVSVILESLAANRGKTLYCAVDQSDTFTKAETWQAGKDRNERDDTVYYGESGRFRGFLAAQEGYLTDGESGVTGISRERIFEFPEEQRRRGWKRVTKRLHLPRPGEAALLSSSPWGRASGANRNDQGVAEMDARRRVNGHHGTLWSTICGPANTDALYAPENSIGSNRCRDSEFVGWTQTAAQAECERRGYERAVNTADDHTTEAWEYGPNITTSSLQGTHQYRARRTREYTTTCEKTVRVRRR